MKYISIIPLVAVFVVTFLFMLWLENYDDKQDKIRQEKHEYVANCYAQGKQPQYTVNRRGAIVNIFGCF